MIKEQFRTYLQEYQFDCGAGAAGTVILNFEGKRINHDLLMRKLIVRRNGTEPENLAFFFKRRGYEVFSKENSTLNELRAESARGKLSIVLYQGSGTKREITNQKGGHYSVVAHMSKRYIYLLDSGVDKDYGDGIGWQILPIPVFRARWVDSWPDNGKEVCFERWRVSLKPKATE
ncbi:MAG TPA: cysteine peptidase family C39 domain-containing protein [Patescibacteria group bacterium]|nr:cysteine peptidase family C39 domain-containing protein [Patescibacteria group bacterium]